jgi:hypothetical protein
VEISVLKAPKIAPKIDFLKNGPWGDFVNTHFRNYGPPLIEQKNKMRPLFP